MREKYRSTLSLFRTWTLFIFIFISVMLMIVGSQVYANTVMTMDKNAALRTAVGYIVNKQREFGSSYEAKEDMLIFYPMPDGEKYICRLYEHEGKLMESLLPIAYDFEPGDGEVIGELDRFEVRREEDRIELRLTYAENRIVKVLEEE
ncbi:MAG: DUF4860 domain-containing protein [Peptostreptococcaceae bacterium]|nr:DUF4860 domain-containing protein [Peptostreptococcaceae bacterium]